MIKLSQLIQPKLIKVPMEATEKFAAIEELVNVLYEAGQITHKAALLEAIFEREATRSTGIGQGLAIPHAKCPSLEVLVGAAGKPRQPVDFQSIDGQPVNFIVLFGSPVDQTGPHIQALARLSRLMTTPSFREKISRAATASDVYEAFVKHEQ